MKQFKCDIWQLFYFYIWVFYCLDGEPELAAVCL